MTFENWRFVTSLDTTPDLSLKEYAAMLPVQREQSRESFAVGVYRLCERLGLANQSIEGLAMKAMAE